jgi:hypothetical protein
MKNLGAPENANRTLSAGGLFGCPGVEGVPAFLSVSNYDGNPANRTQIAAGARLTLRERVKYDMICTGLHIECLDTNDDVVRDVAVNIRTSKLEDNWYWTAGPQGSGAAVPIQMIGGTAGGPMWFPTPRLMIAGESIEIDVRAGAALANPLATLKFTFIGRRLRGAEGASIERAAHICGGLEELARLTGYTALVFDPLSLPVPAVAPVPDSDRRTTLDLGKLPYEFMISSVGCILTDGAAGFLHIPGSLAEFKLVNSSTAHELATDFIPTSLFGAATLSEAGDGAGYHPVDVDLGACFRVGQLSAIELWARGLRTNANGGGPDPMFLRVILHGTRVKALPSGSNPRMHPGSVRGLKSAGNAASRFMRGR